MSADELSGAAWQQFICQVCGLIYDEAAGDPDSGLAPGTRFQDIPDDWACPICGVGKADFVPYAPAGVAVRATPALPCAPTAQPRAAGRGRFDAGVVIVGAGRAGWQMAQALRAHDATLPITIVSACSGDVYDKPQLSVAVARGLAVDGLVRETAADAARRLNVRLLCATAAVRIDTASRVLRTSAGPLRWRQLVLAHGAEPALPAVLPAALVWRVNDLASYQRLRAALQRAPQGPPQRIVLIGAGLVGCELANDLALAGHPITLLDRQTRLLPAQLPDAASERLLRAWRRLPIRFVGGVQVSGVERLPSGLLRVHTLGGPHHDGDQVIAATGLRTADHLARSAGLAFDRTAGGIVVDEARCATSADGIYALGDCAVVGGAASRYIEPIGRQARAIAAAITGHPSAAIGDSPPTVLRVKTSHLPITLTSLLGEAASDAAQWHTDRDDDEALQMRRLSASGRLLATLVAGPARPQAAALDVGR